MKFKKAAFSSLTICATSLVATALMGAFRPAAADYSLSFGPIEVTAPTRPLNLRVLRESAAEAATTASITAVVSYVATVPTLGGFINRHCWSGGAIDGGPKRTLVKLDPLRLSQDEVGFEVDTLIPEDPCKQKLEQVDINFKGTSGRTLSLRLNSHLFEGGQKPLSQDEMVSYPSSMEAGYMAVYDLTRDPLKRFGSELRIHLY